MKVREIMTQSALCCTTETNAGTAVEHMWNRNCGMLPVVDANQKLIGVVTDRDICIALATRNRLPGDLTVGDIAMKCVHSCKPDDEIHEALDTMAKKQVRRLPVVDNKGVPQGILSMDDIILHTDQNKLQGFCELTSEEVIRALKKVYGPQFPMVHKQTAAA
jgi:signal-transduction protein with cAMP-binding, CBS, and nucleotidyltransferase domain